MDDTNRPPRFNPKRGVAREQRELSRTAGRSNFSRTVDATICFVNYILLYLGVATSSAIRPSPPCYDGRSKRNRAAAHLLAQYTMNTNKKKRLEANEEIASWDMGKAYS